MKITADEVLTYYNRTEFQHGKESRTKWLQENSRLRRADFLNFPRVCV